MTMADYQELLIGVTCRWCDHKVELTGPVEGYKHSGGFVVEGQKEKQWLFTVCPGCGYGWSLIKLARMINKEKNEKITTLLNID